MTIKAQLAARVEAAFAQVGLEGPAIIQASSRPDFGDYQANGVMGAAKRAGANPREQAQAVIDALDVGDMASKVEVAGPGFINITLSERYLAQHLSGQVAPVDDPQRIVVDYSAPNLAKEMHVGHLRSTIIGDCLARVLEAQGHTVVRQNHVGDWGTQFGMLLVYLQDADGDSDDLKDLEQFYQAAKKRFDEDADFQDRARSAVVGLQSGDANANMQWQRFIDISMSHCQHIYDRLGVTLSREDVAGESMYNDDLANVIAVLKQQDLLRESDGAQCVFLDEFKNKNGDPLPVIVQKSDGGYLYATTDLAAIRYRTGQLAADRVLYFVDVRQSLHFKQIFAVSTLAGFNPHAASLEHMPFGTMLGKDGKPFKTRSGGVVKLAEVLDEAEERARALAQEKNPDLADADAKHLGRVIGIGAVKYADLSKNRTTDYVFDWDQMLSLQGNTAPYMLYAYTRIRSIFSEGQIDPSSLPESAIPEGEQERQLALAIAGFNDTLSQVSEEGYPHLLCTYLYELASQFSRFYEACPILKADEAVKTRRLVLCQRTAITLAQGLDLLGIEVVERM